MLVLVGFVGYGELCFRVWVFGFWVLIVLFDFWCFVVFVVALLSDDFVAFSASLCFCLIVYVWFGVCLFYYVPIVFALGFVFCGFCLRLFCVGFGCLVFVVNGCRLVF